VKKAGYIYSIDEDKDEDEDNNNNYIIYLQIEAKIFYKVIFSEAKFYIYS
jgi:hypothetical protein